MTTKKTYAEKLRDPRWQKKRLEIMNRDRFDCQLCYSKDKTLNVHHRYYLKGKSPWEYQNEALITLCEECHERVHAAQNKANVWFANLKISDLVEVFSDYSGDYISAASDVQSALVEDCITDADMKLHFALEEIRRLKEEGAK